MTIDVTKMIIDVSNRTIDVTKMTIAFRKITTDDRIVFTSKTHSRHIGSEEWSGATADGKSIITTWDFMIKKRILITTTMAMLTTTMVRMITSPLHISRAAITLLPRWGGIFIFVQLCTFINLKSKAIINFNLRMWIHFNWETVRVFLLPPVNLTLVKCQSKHHKTS